MGGENGLVGWGGGRNMIREGPQGEGGNFGARKIKERGGGSRRGRGNCLEEVQIKKIPPSTKKIEVGCEICVWRKFRLLKQELRWLRSDTFMTT